MNFVSGPGRSCVIPGAGPLSCAISVLMRPFATLALVVGLVLGLAAPAAAADSSTITIRGYAECDHETRSWLITWTVSNSADVAGTTGNVRMDPPGRALVGLPRRIAGGETVTATQRLLTTEYTAHLQLDVNWDDGTVTYDHHWPVYIKSSCR